MLYPRHYSRSWDTAVKKVHKVPAIKEFTFYIRVCGRRQKANPYIIYWGYSVKLTRDQFGEGSPRKVRSTHTSVRPLPYNVPFAILYQLKLKNATRIRQQGPDQGRTPSFFSILIFNIILSTLCTLCCTEQNYILHTHTQKNNITPSNFAV